MITLHILIHSARLFVEETRGGRLHCFPDLRSQPGVGAPLSQHADEDVHSATSSRYVGMGSRAHVLPDVVVPLLVGMKEHVDPKAKSACKDGAVAVIIVWSFS